MPTTESQKRASRAYYLKNKEYCKMLTTQWREDNYDLWLDMQNEYSKKSSKRKRDYLKEAKRFLNMEVFNF